MDHRRTRRPERRLQRALRLDSDKTVQLRLHRRGESPESIAAALSIPVVVSTVLSSWAIGTVGWGNHYYAAAVRSMSQSWTAFFYGSLLGAFILALGVKRANATGAFWGLIGGMLTVAAVAWWNGPSEAHLSYLWYNVIGAVAVTVIGVALSAVSGKPRAA